MRLIDIDALTYGMDEYDELPVGWARNLPSIDAIPVDWMCDYTTQKYGSEETQIDKMIDDWRREHEID